MEGDRLRKQPPRVVYELLSSPLRCACVNLILTICTDIEN